MVTMTTMTALATLIASPRWARLAALVMVGFGATSAAPAARAGEVLERLFRGLAAPAKAAHRVPPATGADGAVERLADELDWLEHHIDRFGSIVAKHPDIWGQSRLTRHRAEYERLLAAEAAPGKFQDVANASLRRSDQSFLGLALAIQGAAAASGTTRGRGDSSIQNVTTLVSTGTDAGKGAIPLARTPPFARAKDAGDDVAEFGLANANRIGLEPTIHLDHLDRYIKHLQELRRINEGDDIADSPGYALNLVRIPVSILPGEITQRGHGAEISVIADVVLGDDLLPATFRNLVINDVVDTLAPFLTFAVNDATMRRALEARRRPHPACGCGTAEPGDAALSSGAALAGQTDLRETVSRLQRTATVSVPSSKTRRARMPLPPEQVVDVVGGAQVGVLVAAVYEALHAHPANAPCIQYADVRAFLAEELQGAYEFLAQPRQAAAWADLPAWNLHEPIRSRRAGELEQRRRMFFDQLGFDAAAPLDAIGMGGDERAPQSQLRAEVPVGGAAAACDNAVDGTRICGTTSAVLAWAILVESALLNERLVEDIRETATARGAIAMDDGRSGPFYGPNPGPEARRAFNDHVRRRWPIRVFALDPVTQEQNVEDTYAMRRETQIALALAAADGRLSSQALLRYARRLETDLATVALNKTAVGFSHGNDTFGWRFYPRVQSPPTRNNLVNFAETLVGSNSTTRDLCERRIEPGMRECTAIVVMPSFVPHVTLDVRTNWFSLAHPKVTDQSLRQTLELSRSVKAMQQSAAICGRCAGAYRDGEVARLLRRVEQLDRELPLQTMLAQIPHENTSGGCELFNTGVTDLAPELIGWYGAEGIDPHGETTAYIVGKGFSVHDTSIVAGGKTVAKVELISRQVLKATFPAGLRPRRLPRPADCRDVGGMPPRPPAPGVARGMQKHERVVLVGAAAEEVPPGLPAPAAAPPSGPEARVTSPTLSFDVPVEAIPTPAAPAVAAGCEGGCEAGCDGGCDAGCEAGCEAGNALDCNALDVVDVHLATPYGVSNHLLIPVLDASDAGAAGLALETDVTLTLFPQKTTADTWRLGEYYEATASEIVIRAPDVFIPPAKAQVRFLIRQVGGDAFATIAIPAPPFDGRTGVYRLAGADLRNFVGDGSRPASDTTLRGALAPFVNHSGGAAALFVAEATLVTDTREVPIGGALNVVVGQPEKAAGPAPAAENSATPEKPQ